MVSEAGCMCAGGCVCVTTVTGSLQVRGATDYWGRYVSVSIPWHVDLLKHIYRPVCEPVIRVPLTFVIL